MLGSSAQNHRLMGSEASQAWFLWAPQGLHSQGTEGCLLSKQVVGHVCPGGRMRALQLDYPQSPSPSTAAGALATRSTTKGISLCPEPLDLGPPVPLQPGGSAIPQTPVSCPNALASRSPSVPQHTTSRVPACQTQDSNPSLATFLPFSDSGNGPQKGWRSPSKHG